jgi:nucleoside-diphosphate-sugar epimerase
MSIRSVAVTGATGFIGGAIVRSLLDGGWRVRALVRPSSIDKPLPPDVERVVGSLSDVASLRQLLSATNAVVHCAGVVRGARRSTFMRNNAEAVERLATLAAAETGVDRFLLVSSLAATKPEISPYAASKRAGELALERESGGMAWMALRPPPVYGPGDREILPLFKVMARGVAPMWGNRDARFSLIFIADVVSAIEQWLNSTAPASGVFELDDGRVDGYTMDDVANIIAAVVQRRVHRVPVPPVVLGVVAAINVRLARLAGYEPMLTPWKLNELRHPRWVCDNTAFTAATGWQPGAELVTALPLALKGSAGQTNAISKP